MNYYAISPGSVFNTEKGKWQPHVKSYLNDELYEEKSYDIFFDDERMADMLAGCIANDIVRRNRPTISNLLRKLGN